MEIAYCCRETKPFAYSILELVFFNRRAYRVSVSFASYSFLYFISHCFLFSISIAPASSSICDEFEEMSMHAGERPKETAEVVALQNYLNECKEKRIVKLKNEIRAAAERVVFLLYHATLDGKSLSFPEHFEFRFFGCSFLSCISRELFIETCFLSFLLLLLSMCDGYKQ